MRRIATALVLLAAVAAAGWLSSRVPSRDSVAAAEKELGIELEQLWVDVDQVSLRVVAAGPADGPPVVLLHGFPELWYAWRRPLAALAAAGFRVYAPDQRGYGESDKPRRVEDYRIEALVSDVAELIAALGHESALVAAHDWGGGVAWRLALSHPERVRRLVMIDTPHPGARRLGPSQDDTATWFRLFFQIPWLPEWTLGLAHWRPLTRVLQRGSRAGAFSDQDLAILRSAWAKDGSFGSMVNWYRAFYRYPPPDVGEGRVRVPTLLIAAPHDAYISGDLTRASVEFLDDGRLVELERGSHWVIQEEPEEISRLLVEFFSAKD